MKSQDAIRTWHQRVNDRHMDVYQAVTSDPYIQEEDRRNIARWLACAEGTRRALGWVMGNSTYAEAFYCLKPKFLNNMRLPHWDEKWGEPTGRLSFGAEDTAPYRLRDSGDVLLMLKTANMIHSRVFNIDKFHPGAWHPMFHDRVKDWLVFAAGVVRALDWALGNKTDAETFYVFSEKSMDELMKAKSGVHGYSADALIGIDFLLGMDLTEKDF